MGDEDGKKGGKYSKQISDSGDRFSFIFKLCLHLDPDIASGKRNILFTQDSGKKTKEHRSPRSENYTLYLPPSRPPCFSLAPTFQQKFNQNIS